MNNPDQAKQVRLKYNGVVVIQSLPDKEIQTGKELYDSIISRRCGLTSKAAYFYNPSTVQEFFNALDEICANVLYDELMPIIHFEMHGNPKGLVVKNGVAVGWEALQDHLRLINRKTQNQLIVTLASCWGSRVWEMIDITQAAPYWGYIGPKESILADVLMEDFTDFFDTLLSTDHLDAAIERLKANGTRTQYSYLNCKAIFEYHIERRLQGQPMDKKAAFHRLKGKTKENAPGLNRAARRKELKKSIDKLNRPAFIAQMKKVFLMADQD